MALDLQSLSLTSAFNSIVNYFKSQENNSQWHDMTSSSEGSFLIRLLANVISTLSYRIIAQTRENFLSTAALTSSNVGMAVNLGYSVFRGSNLKRLVYLTPSGNYTLPKFSIIGSYSENYNILTLDNVELVEGETTKIRTVVGNLKEESFVAGTSDIKIFSLFTSGISEDYILYKDGEEVPKFGCSDCNCNSHLIYFKRKRDAMNSVKSAYDKIDMEYHNLSYFKKELIKNKN